VAEQSRQHDDLLHREPATCRGSIAAAELPHRWIRGGAKEVYLHTGGCADTLVCHSIHYSSRADSRTCSTHDRSHQIIDPAGDVRIHFTYSVTWKKTTISWSNRWDRYMSSAPGDVRVQWFSIVNSLVIVTLMTGMVAFIMIRTLRADLLRYNVQLEQLVESGNPKEEFGWKLCHGDVFRPPANRVLLASLVGTGMQLIGMFVVLLCFALTGFLAPGNRGALLSSFPVLFVFMG
jgi:transmembrane 9 superfamily protein 2/4